MRDLTGLVVGKLTVLSQNGRTKKKCVVWLCQCSCGNKAAVTSTHLVTGHTKSCGCHRVEQLRSIAKKHGMSGTSEHNIWLSMRARCENPNSDAYHRYGGRGIKVCDEWMDFGRFYSDMGPRPAKHSIDRINNDGNYEPSNCRWATQTEQTHNTSTNRLVEYKGKKVSLRALSLESGLSYKMLHARLTRGYTVEEAVTKPVQLQKIRKEYTATKAATEATNV